ncbi:MAG: pilin [Candidatus Berkelbacteria bacterium]|nr:pilin [Candidatus Berkelbacteria bacterium]
MIDKLSWFFIEKAHASPGWFSTAGSNDTFFGIFNPFSFEPSTNNAKSTFSGILGTVMSWVLAVVAVIAFVYLIISGVNYITAGGDSEKATKARAGILNAIIGIVVVVLSYFILRFAATLGGNLVNR